MQGASGEKRKLVASGRGAVNAQTNPKAHQGHMFFARAESGNLFLDAPAKSIPTLLIGGQYNVMWNEIPNPRKPSCSNLWASRP